MRPTLLLASIFTYAAIAQTPVETVRVVSRAVERTLRLPGEFMPYESVELRARVQGYVDRVLVDRGSLVRKGALLVVLDAPEMRAQLAEAESREQVVLSQRAEAEARLAGARANLERLERGVENPRRDIRQRARAVRTAVDANRAAMEAATPRQRRLTRRYRRSAIFKPICVSRRRSVAS